MIKLFLEKQGLNFFEHLEDLVKGEEGEIIFTFLDKNKKKHVCQVISECFAVENQLKILDSLSEYVIVLDTIN